jgi:magnesium transporter
MIKARGRWLVLLLIGSMLTTTAMESFQDQIDRAPILAVFIAMIVSTGGNSGSQASTLVIRAMALGEIRTADWWLILRRELVIGFALGLVLFAVAMLRVLIWGSFGAYGENYVMIAFAVSISVVGCTTCGTLAGAMLPFVLRKFGADPASASAPFVATLVDVSGILIYFGIANLMLRGVLPL